MGTFANSVDPDEMSHYAVFYPSLHCIGKNSSDKITQYFFNYNLTPLDNYVQW